MSIVAMTYVFQHSEAKLGARLVLLALAEHAHDDGTEAYPSVETLVERSRMSRKGVQTALRRLEADGMILRAGVGPRGQTKWTVILGGEVSTPPGGEGATPGGRIPGLEGGEAPTPEPSVEPSLPLNGARAHDPERIPEDFPDELEPHLEAVVPILRSVAETKGADAVHRGAVARTIQARPRRPIVKAAHDFAAYFESGRGARRPQRDVVAGYRNWLDREPDLAGPERLPGMGDGGGFNPPVAQDERSVRRRRRGEALSRAAEGRV